MVLCIVWLLLSLLTCLFGMVFAFLYLQEAPYVSVGTNEGIHGDEQIGNSEEKGGPSLEHQYDVGVVTGNWGCGAFGGDLEIKTTIQWLAASQVTPFTYF